MLKIKLLSPSEVGEFVGITNSFDFDITLLDNRQEVDAKSLLGVSAINNPNGCTVRLATEDPNMYSAVKTALQKYLV